MTIDSKPITQVHLRKEFEGGDLQFQLDPERET